MRAYFSGSLGNGLCSVGISKVVDGARVAVGRGGSSILFGAGNERFAVGGGSISLRDFERGDGVVTPVVSRGTRGTGSFGRVLVGRRRRGGDVGL